MKYRLKLGTLWAAHISSTRIEFTNNPDIAETFDTEDDAHDAKWKVRLILDLALTPQVEKAGNG